MTERRGNTTKPFATSDRLTMSTVQLPSGAVEAAIRDGSLRQAAQANPVDKFQLVFRQVLEALFIERMVMNDDIFARFMNEPEFQELVAQGRFTSGS